MTRNKLPIATNNHSKVLISSTVTLSFKVHASKSLVFFIVVVVVFNPHVLFLSHSSGPIYQQICQFAFECIQKQMTFHHLHLHPLI